MACNCCNVPTCPAIVVQYDSVAASKTKCTNLPEFTGYASSPPKFYLQRETTYAGTNTFTGTSPDGSVTETYTSTFGHSSTEVIDPDSCTSSTTCTGADTSENSGNLGGGDTFDATCTLTYNSDCSTSLSCSDSSHGFSPVWGDTHGVATTTVTTTPSVETTTIIGSGSTRGLYSIDTDSISETLTVTLSDEYTTDDLISRAAAALGSYPGTWTGSPAYYNLSGTEENVSIRNAKARLQHQPVDGWCYLKVWMAQIFVPDDSSVAASKVSGSTYEWTGSPSTGNICLADPTKGTADAANLITGTTGNGGQIEIDYTAVKAKGNGTIQWVPWKWSAVQGYEPADPTLNHDGSLSRPSPDATPNCTPAL